MGDDEEQFGLFLEKGLKDDFNKKCIEEERTMSEVARELLEQWTYRIASKVSNGWNKGVSERFGKRSKRLVLTQRKRRR